MATLLNLNFPQSHIVVVRPSRYLIMLVFLYIEIKDFRYILYCDVSELIIRRLVATKISYRAEMQGFLSILRRIMRYSILKGIYIVLFFF